MKKEKRTVGDAIVKLIDNIADLVDIKTFLSVGLVGAAIWGFLTDRLDQNVFVAIVSSVITYFFTKRSGGREADSNTNKNTNTIGKDNTNDNT